MVKYRPTLVLKKDVPSLPHYSISLYINELETYLDKINGEFSCLFNIVVAILLDVDDVVLFTSSGHHTYTNF
jgi:hypothetical protein